MARKHQDERRGRRGSSIEVLNSSTSTSAGVSSVASAVSIGGGSSSTLPGARRATACGRRSISAEQRARYLKAFLVWLLFSLGGWLGIPPDYLPIYSHCVGFGFFIVMTTNKTRWLGALFFGGLLFAFLMWRTLPSHWVAVVTNSFGYTALALSCVIVTGCTVVRHTLPGSAVASALSGGAGSGGGSATGSAHSSASTTPERLSRSRGGFASFRNKILRSSCGDSSIAKFCSGRYLEEHLERRGVVTLDEQTGRVSELHLLGSTGPALHVDAAVDHASQVLRRAGSWVDEVGHILLRVATDPHFIRFLKDAAEERGMVYEDEDDEEQYEGVQGRSIHVLDDFNAPLSPSPSPSSSAEGEGEEPQPGEQGPTTQPQSSVGTPSPPPPPPSFSRSTSDSAAAAAAAAAAAQLVEAAAAGVDSAAFLAHAPRGHLYAVIRHLNSQLLRVEASLRAAEEESERAEAQRAVFAGTIRTLKANLDRECATRMQLTNQWQRQREEEAREAKRLAKHAGGATTGGSGGTTTAAGDDSIGGGSLGGSDSAHSKQLHAHVRELSKKCKQLTNEHWNASYALSLAGQKNQALQQALEQAAKEAAAERSAAATRAREQAAAAQETLTRAHEEHARALAKASQEAQARIGALEAQRRALEQKVQSQQNAAAAAKQAVAASAASAAAASTAATSAPVSSSSRISTSENRSETNDDSPSPTDHSSPSHACSALATVAQLQTQLAEAAHQARAQSVETARREHRTAAQLERQSGALARLAQEKGALESSVCALQAALQDARSQLSVEQAIVSSLSSAVDDPAAAAAWHASPDARALAAIFARDADADAATGGTRVSSLGEDGDDGGTMDASDGFELLETSNASYWMATSAYASDALDPQSLLAHSIVDSVSSPPMLGAAHAPASEQRGVRSRQTAADPVAPSLLPPAAVAAPSASRPSWSLYEHGGPRRSGGGVDYTPLAPSAALWGNAPIALGLQLQLSSGGAGCDEHSQLSRQLDALEARVKQLKQQQLQQHQPHASPALSSWPS